MSNNIITMLQSDSAPEVVYELVDNSTKQPINLHSNTTAGWLKFAKMNHNNTIYLIMGEKINGGFDGQLRFSHTDPSTGDSLLVDLNPSRYQGEIFITSNTYSITLNSLDDTGLFTTNSDHFLGTGDKIWFTNVPEDDMNEVIGNAEWTVTVVSPTTFTVQESLVPPTSTVNFASALLYNITDTETSVEVSPYYIKKELTP